VISIDSLPGVNLEEHIKGIIRKAAEKVLAMENNENCELSIFLTDDEEIHRLNKIYRNVDRPTDVLAFAMREGSDNLNYEVLGDVVISMPTAKRQSIAYGHSLESEIALLVAHGILHLLGYDHEKKDDLVIMEKKQKEVVRSVIIEQNNSLGFIEG